MKTLVILGHVRKDSLCGSLARAYEDAALAQGSETRTINIGDLEFDLAADSRHYDRPLEPDIIAAQEAIRWADHIVWVFPTWWGTFPAILKAFFDRVLLSQFAFRYGKGPIPLQKLLKGKTFRILVTMDAPWFYYRWVQGAPGTNAMRKSIMGFCGLKELGTTVFTPVRTSTAEKRLGWLTQAAAAAQNDARWWTRHGKRLARSNASVRPTAV